MSDTLLSDLHDALLALLRREQPDARDCALRGLAALPGGNARRAFSFDLQWDDADGAHGAACVALLRGEAGQLERDLAPEFAVLAALGASEVPAPGALWCDAVGEILPAPGFVMERVPGESSLRGLLDPAESERNESIARDLAAAAAALHGVDWQAAGLWGDAVSDPAAVAAEEVAAWEAVYRERRLEPLSGLHYAFAWLRENAPVAERVSIVHGDLRFGNVLYEGDSLRALLDWEMAHPGDPCEDIAWAYRALWSPEAALPLEAFLEHYRAAGGPPIAEENLAFYRLFSEVKHAVISLTGANAFARGRTRNLRLADRMSWVPECLEEFYALLPEVPKP